MKKIDKAFNAMVWIESLELDYKQGGRKLGSYEDGLCCLGLACYVNELPYKSSHEFLSNNNAKSLGLIDDCGYPANGYLPEVKNLIYYNDSDGKSFKQIAKILKKHPHAYFEKEVADEIQLAYSQENN